MDVVERVGVLACRTGQRVDDLGGRVAAVLGPRQRETFLMIVHCFLGEPLGELTTRPSERYLPILVQPVE